ncbi:hypothetical protein [Aeromonas enterica]
MSRATPQQSLLAMDSYPRPGTSLAGVHTLRDVVINYQVLVPEFPP